MIKLPVSDIMAIMRRFEVATDEDTNRLIDQIKRLSPDAESLVVTFRFRKKRYVIIFDHRAEDDSDYLLDIVRSVEPNATGSFAENPYDDRKLYSLPFKGKEAYLFMLETGKTRLDKELVRRYPDISRSTLQKYIRMGDVSVNQEVQTHPRFEVDQNDDISVALREKPDFSEHQLPIIFLDDNVMVVNKPVGALSHSKGALNDEFSVADFFARFTSYHLDTNRPGIVHRLDRDTSGVMIGARNDQTADLLQKQFAQRKTVKTYYAVLDGVPKLEKAVIDLPIGRHPSLPSTFRIDPQGKSAVTSYEILAVNGNKALVRLRPQTGRTHQLRVHMAYVNAPILGDRVYGKKADRLYLHAASLEITIPLSDRRTFSADIPDEFLSLFPGVMIDGA